MEKSMNLEQFKTMISSKQDFYEAMQRNGWYLPKISTSVVTIQMLLDIKERKVWCPTYLEFKKRPCPKPPLKIFILQEILKELNKMNPEIKFICDEQSKCMPDQEWLLDCLSTLSPNHKYFGKNYYPQEDELSQRKNKKCNEINLKADDDFFKGLPKTKNQNAKNNVFHKMNGSNKGNLKKYRDQKDSSESEKEEDELNNLTSKQIAELIKKLNKLEVQKMETQSQYIFQKNEYQTDNQIFIQSQKNNKSFIFDDNKENISKNKNKYDDEIMK